VLVGAPDFASWTALQRRALFDFLRSGGTIVFFGAIDERSSLPRRSGRRSSTPRSLREPRSGRSPSGFIACGMRRCHGPMGTVRAPSRCSSCGASARASSDTWPSIPSWPPPLSASEGRSASLDVRGPSAHRSLPGCPVILLRLVGGPEGGREVAPRGGAYFVVYTLILGPVMLLLFRSRGTGSGCGSTRRR